jgi:hypothetical protein
MQDEDALTSQKEEEEMEHIKVWKSLEMSFNSPYSTFTTSQSSALQDADLIEQVYHSLNRGVANRLACEADPYNDMEEAKQREFNKKLETLKGKLEKGKGLPRKKSFKKCFSLQKGYRPAK